MPQYRRIGIAAVVLSCAASVAFGLAATSASLREEKQAAIQAALETTGAAPGQEAVLAMAAQANALLEIRAGNDPAEAALTLLTTALPETNVFAQDAGRRVVIDLADVVNLSTPGVINLSAVPLINSACVNLFAVNPRFVSRVVLELDYPAGCSLTKGPDRYSIYLQANDHGVAALQALQPAPGLEKTAAGLARFRIDILVAKAGQDEPAPAHAKLDQPRLAALVEQLNELNPAPAQATPDGIAESTLAQVAEGSLHLARDFSITNTKAPLPAAAPKIARLARGLQAVADIPLDLVDAEAVLLAAVGEEAAVDSSTDPDGEAADALEAKEEELSEASPDAPAAAGEEAPVPPGKRTETVPDTTDANANIVSTVQSLISGLGSGRDLAAEQGLRTAGASSATVEAAPIAVAQAPAPKPYRGNPLDQPVDVDFRDMDLNNVVALLAHKAGINVIAGTDVSGTVTANLKNVPLRQAMETALRMNQLGLIEEEGIYLIVPYDEALTAERDTQIIKLENAKANEIQAVLEDILKGSRDQNLINISSNDTANLVVVAGPKDRIDPYIAMAQQLDVAEPVLPTITQSIKLNYAEPDELVLTIEKMLTPEIGNVTADNRARHLIITDVPVVVEQVCQLVKQLDVAVKQVLIESMVVNAFLADEAETGIDWLMSAVKRQSTRDEIEGNDVYVGNLQELALGTSMASGAANLLNFGILTGDMDWRGLIQAEVRSRNLDLVSNPIIMTVENKPAEITIAQEIPYIELTQTDAGGSQTNTEFKEVGTILTVTPRVTHDNTIILDFEGKESTTSGEFNGVPIEDKRSASSTLRVHNGQTIFIGGLRSYNMTNSVRRVPILGDIPVMNFLFRANNRTEQSNELMIFLTSTVLSDDPPELTPHQQQTYDQYRDGDFPVNAAAGVAHETVHPAQYRDPIWKWRRP